MLTVENLEKNYGEMRALAGVSLVVKEGEFLGLLGPNGAGKSTLMQCITGYVRPDRGNVSYHGSVLDVYNPDQRRVFGLVPQEIALYDTLSAAENLYLFGRLNGLSGRHLKHRVAELLVAVGLAERAHDQVRTFSGGMKRRLNIAASLVHKPKILYCDEVTVGVDPQSRSAIFGLLEKLNRGGMTIVYTTHYMEEVQRLCPRIAIMDRGHVLADGSLADLLSLLPEGRSVRWAAGNSVTKNNFETDAAAFGHVRRDESGHFVDLFPRDDFEADAFFSRAQRAGMSPWDFSMRKGTLEDVFLHLTGRKLRDK